MLTQEEIEAMQDKEFYLCFNELAKKRELTKREKAEYRLLLIDHAKRKMGLRDPEAIKKRMRNDEEWDRFLEALDDLLDQPQAHKFQELQRVRLKVACSPEAPKGTEGFVSEVITPAFERYRQDGRLVFAYELVVHQFNPDTLKVYGQTTISASEEDLEPINEYTVARLFNQRYSEFSKEL